jgi:hypothetical protein
VSIRRVSVSSASKESAFLEGYTVIRTSTIDSPSLSPDSSASATPKIEKSVTFDLSNGIFSEDDYQAAIALQEAGHSDDEENLHGSRTLAGTSDLCPSPKYKEPKHLLLSLRQVFSLLSAVSAVIRFILDAAMGTQR